MKIIHKKPKKSSFIRKSIFFVNKKHKKNINNVKKIFDKISNLETVGYADGTVSKDGRKKPIFLSKDIIEKIEYDHGKICIEDLINSVHNWEYAVMYPYKDIDKINLIKLIPNSYNYFVVAANRNNGFFMVTHFETKSKNDKNLKRLLGRGNVISRGPSVCLYTNRGDEPTREGV